jgi:hypothetical protein
MPHPVWPPSLPQTPFVGWEEEREPNTVIFKPDVGPSKIRRRGTLARRFQSTPIELNGTQLAAFNTFFYDTLQHGTLEFVWQDMLDANHAGSGTARVFRFRDGKAPVWRMTVGSLSGNTRWYSGTIELELMPTVPT